jgi:CheY-like chemotaxis protein
LALQLRASVGNFARPFKGLPAWGGAGNTAKVGFMGFQGESAVVQSAPSITKEERISRRRLRVLLVDNSAYVLRAARSLLETMPRIGDVVSASSGRAALELTVPGAFDFVLLDLAMDGLNGLEVARELKRRPGSPRIFMMSLHDEPEFGAAAVAAGADVLIHKPSLGVQLEPLLARLFARAA